MTSLVGLIGFNPPQLRVPKGDDLPCNKCWSMRNLLLDCCLNWLCSMRTQLVSGVQLDPLLESTPRSISYKHKYCNSNRLWLHGCCQVAEAGNMTKEPFIITQ